jgi:hypothetical protein
MKIVRLLVVSASIIAIILLIPGITTPILDVLDVVLGSELSLIATQVYAILPDQLNTLMILQLSTLVITIAIRFAVGGAPHEKK